MDKNINNQIYLKTCTSCGIKFYSTKSATRYCEACKELITKLNARRGRVKYNQTHTDAERPPITKGLTIADKRLVKAGKSLIKDETKPVEIQPVENPVVIKTLEDIENEHENDETKNAVKLVKPVKNDDDDDFKKIEKSINDCVDLLDTIYDEIQKIIDTLREKQSEYDKRDSDFLHEIENADNDAILAKLVRQQRISRGQRRDYKNYIGFLINIAKKLPQNTRQSFEIAKRIQAEKRDFYKNN